MEKIAIYPGTFDPITNGHIDVIERSALMYDKVILVIAINSKKQSLFSHEERLEMANDALKHIKNVEITFHNGLIVDFAIKAKASCIIRGVRAVTDFEYEFQLALMNRKISDISTVFLMPHEKYTYLNSSIIRELAKYNQDVSDFVPSLVQKKLKEKFGFSD
jgi:pantetheine-phosphate adenylyltransferase